MKINKYIAGLLIGATLGLQDVPAAEYRPLQEKRSTQYAGDKSESASVWRSETKGKSADGEYFAGPTGGCIRPKLPDDLEPKPKFPFPKEWISRGDSSIENTDEFVWGGCTIYPWDIHMHLDENMKRTLNPKYSPELIQVYLGDVDSERKNLLADSEAIDAVSNEGIIPGGGGGGVFAPRFGGGSGLFGPKVMGNFSPAPRTMPVSPFDDLPEKLEDFLKEKETQQRPPRNYIANVCKPDKEPGEPGCPKNSGLMETAYVDREEDFRLETDEGNLKMRRPPPPELGESVALVVPTTYPAIDPENPDHDWCPTRPKPPKQEDDLDDLNPFGPCGPDFPEPKPFPEPRPFGPCGPENPKRDYMTINDRLMEIALNQCDGTYKRYKIDLGPIEFEYESCEPKESTDKNKGGKPS